MKKPVVFGGDYEKRGLFWRRDMPIIIAGMFILALATMDMIIRGPLKSVEQQIEEIKSYSPANLSSLAEKVYNLEQRIENEARCPSNN